MGKILTVSVAAYNMERYISQTLDSLIDERVIDDIEVFVVDDGGTDRTLEIAKQYAAKYPNSIFPVHKENGGYGSTVNYSIAHATGKYFKLLDGDDWFDTDGLYQLVQTLKDIDIDVVITPMYKGADADSLKRISPADMPEGTFAIKDMSVKDIHGMWVITFKTDVIRQSGLNLPERKFYMDQLFSTIPFSVAKTICYKNFCVYCYRVGRDGQSVTRESRIKNTDSMLLSVQLLCEFYDAQKDKGCDGLRYIKRRVATYYRSAIKTLLLHPVSKEARNNLIKYEETIRGISKEIYDEVVHCGKMGLLISLFRMTNYSAYWLIKLIPGGVPNWA